MPDDLFSSTAWYYARYRPGYPQELFDLVIDRFGLDGTGRMLDLGCGTGQMILPLAGHVAEVIGMDPEPEMLAEARRVVQASGITNVGWLEGGSDDIDRLASQLSPLRLVTMGRSFHWMDAEATIQSLGRVVHPGGGVVITGDGCGLWNGELPWQQAVSETVREFLGERRRAGSSYTTKTEVRWELLLPGIAAPMFREPEFHQFQERRWWDVDGILGHLYSTSFCSPAVLGEQREAFEAAVRARLLEIDLDGRFSEDVVIDVALLESSSQSANG